MATWLVPYEELSDEQRQAVKFGSDRHRVVFGSPGSGKTLILLHRAARLVREHGVQPGRFRIFVFTNVLKDYIRSALGLLGLPEDCILTYDHWCNLYYTEKIGRRIPMKWRTPDYEAIRQAVYRHVQRSSASMPLYDFVLVDEGQDLDPVSFETMKMVSRHVTVCMDRNQRIYENGAAEEEIMRQLGLNRRNMLVLGAYRCCPYVARLGGQLIADEAEREEYLRLSRTVQTERQTPLLYYASGPGDESRRMIEAIRTRQGRGDRIGILLPTNRHVMGFASELRGAGLDVEVHKVRDGDGFRPLDFTSDRPKVLTYHSAKGLTFDSVMLPRLVEQDFPSRRPDSADRLLFVGITRATRWAFLSTWGDVPLPLIEKLLPMQDVGCLTVQRAGGDRHHAGGRAAENEGHEERPDGLTDFL